MKLEVLSKEGAKVSMLAKHTDAEKASDQEFENLVEGTKRMLGSGLVGYVTGKRKDGLIVEFFGCQTPENC